MASASVITSSSSNPTAATNTEQVEHIQSSLSRLSSLLDLIDHARSSLPTVIDAIHKPLSTTVAHPNKHVNAGETGAVAMAGDKTKGKEKEKEKGKAIEKAGGAVGAKNVQLEMAVENYRAKVKEARKTLDGLRKGVKESKVAFSHARDTASSPSFGLTPTQITSFLTENENDEIHFSLPFIPLLLKNITANGGIASIPTPQGTKTKTKKGTSSNSSSTTHPTTTADSPSTKRLKKGHSLEENTPFPLADFPILKNLSDVKRLLRGKEIIASHNNSDGKCHSISRGKLELMGTGVFGGKNEDVYGNEGFPKGSRVKKRKREGNQERTSAANKRAKSDEINGASAVEENKVGSEDGSATMDVDPTSIGQTIADDDSRHHELNEQSSIPEQKVTFKEEGDNESTSDTVLWIKVRGVMKVCLFVRYPIRRKGKRILTHKNDRMDTDRDEGKEDASNKERDGGFISVEKVTCYGLKEDLPPYKRSSHQLFSLLDVSISSALRSTPIPILSGSKPTSTTIQFPSSAPLILVLSLLSSFAPIGAIQCARCKSVLPPLGERHLHGWKEGTTGPLGRRWAGIIEKDRWDGDKESNGGDGSRRNDGEKMKSPVGKPATSLNDQEKNGKQTIRENGVPKPNKELGSAIPQKLQQEKNGTMGEKDKQSSFLSPKRENSKTVKSHWETTQTGWQAWHEACLEMSKEEQEHGHLPNF